MRFMWKVLLLTVVLLASVSAFWDDDEDEVKTTTVHLPRIQTTAHRAPVHRTPAHIPTTRAPAVNVVPIAARTQPPPQIQVRNQDRVVQVPVPIHAADILPADQFDNIRKSSSGPQYIAKLIKQFAANRQPFHNESRSQVQTFINRWFTHYGLHVEMEEFSFHVILPGNQGTQKMVGQNIIGYLPGRQKGTSNDKLLVIAAHYDTKDTTHGISDNGAAVAVMLDVARELAHRVRTKNITLDRTVAFAALDFQIQEYVDMEIRGHSGVNRYVNYLNDKYLKTSSGVEAIILHSVLNYRPEANSQKLPRGFSQDLPWEYRNITGDGSKGDFLAAVSLTRQNQSVDTELVDQLSSGWERAKVQNSSVRAPFRLRQWHLEEGAQETDFNKMFQTQGQQEFWYYKDANNQRIHLPAILVTDTGEVLRNMHNFCLPNCDDLDQKIPLQIEFLRQLIDTLVNVVVQLQTAGGGSSAVSSSVLFLGFGFLAHLILSKQE